MGKNRENQQGVATIVLLLIAIPLFILLGIVLQAYMSWHKLEMRLLNENKARASEIVLEP